MDAKKKKKCKKPKVKCGKKCCAAGQKCLAGACAVPCAFSTVGSVMTLQASCTTTSMIEIPDGMTLDGNGKTVFLAWSILGFDTDAGIAATFGTANVQNLDIDASRLSGACFVGGNEVAGIMFNTADGFIRDVSVSNISCGAGVVLIESSSGPRRAVDLENVTVVNVNPGGDGLGGGGIEVRGDIDATIEDCAVRQMGGGDFGISVFGIATKATIDGATIEDVDGG